jgi:SAM-dependent methyltransferase
MSHRHAPFFILSCARSGSTSLCAILNEAANGRCVSEPVPNLNRETRDMLEGRIGNPVAVLEATVLPRVKDGMRRVEVYGEKNVTYGPFIPYLYDALRCRFVLIQRDGRDVVTSLINWHEGKFGSIYRECKEAGRLTPEANSAAASLLVHEDASDYSRPRPLKADPLYRTWEDLTRAEMCAYYWSVSNELYLNHLQRLPDETWTAVDYSTVTASAVERVGAFCGLTGLGRERIQAMLDRKINSLEDRGSSAGTYLDWKHWDGGMRRRFDAIASGTMRRLGYYQGEGKEWRPAHYGTWWRNHDGGLAWYTWMYEGRRKMHDDVISWIRERERQGDRISSIVDLGCGVGVGYAEALAGKRYVGVDLSERNVQWCLEHRRNPAHEYQCADFIVEALKEQFDLVLSSGTLDNCYDMDAGLRTMVRQSRKWIYATFYRGWFPDLSEHRYRWSEEHTCFYNDASPARIRETLVQLGCQDILIEPVPTGTGRREIPFETRVIARVPDGPGHP